MGSAVGEGGQRGVDDIYSRLDGLEVGHAGLAAGVVGVELNRYLQALLERLDQVVGIVGRYEPGLVLDAYGIGPHVLKDERLVDKEVHVVDGAAQARLGERIAYRTLDVHAGLFDSLVGRLVIALIVYRIEYPEDVDARLGRLVDEGSDQIVGVVAIADQVLPPQQHHELRLGQELLEDPRPLPGVFSQEAMRDVEGGAAPDLHRIEAALAELVGDELHVLSAHARSKQGLVAVPKGDIADLDRIFPLWSRLYLFGGQFACWDHVSTFLLALR